MSSIFTLLKDFCRSQTDPITLDLTYPFTVTTSSVNHYWSTIRDGMPSEGAKIISRGIKARPVFKSKTRWINSSLGIIERREIKGKAQSCINMSFAEIILSHDAHPKNMSYAGCLFRSRKAIWLVNRLSGRMYHIILDKCKACGKNTLYQIEIEYCGMVKKKIYAPAGRRQARREVIHDTEFLARKILKFAKTIGIKLIPGEEKFKWLTAK